MRWLVNATLRPLYSRERASTQYTGIWVGPRAGLNGCGKTRPLPGFGPRTVKPVASRCTDYETGSLQDEQCYEASEVGTPVRSELMVMTKAELQLLKLQTNCDHNDTKTLEPYHCPDSSAIILQLNLITL